MSREPIVPLVDLKVHTASIRDEIQRAINGVLTRCDFILGSATEEFEVAFADFVGVEHAVGVASGLDALRLSLMALEVGPGDEVILPANTFAATALAVAAVGATPQLVDCNPETLNIDVHKVERAITPRTRVLLPVHLMGQPCDMLPLRRIATRHNLMVVEDAAQSHGATLLGRPVGSLSDIGCFSFYPGKNLGAAGDGGIVTTDNETLATRIRQLRNYGQEAKYRHVVLGTNSRLDTIQAAILNVKLGRLPAWNRSRAEHAARYREELHRVGDLCIPSVDPRVQHVYHLFVVETEYRDVLRQHLESLGVQTGIHYPTPIHLQPAFASLDQPPGSFPVAERVANRILSLPMFPEITPGQIEHVVSAIRDFFEKRR